MDRFAPNGKLGKRLERSRPKPSWPAGKGTRLTRYIIDIEVDKVVEGKGVEPKDVIYVRAWRFKRRGAAGLVPGPSGHFSIPEKGDTVFAYAAKGKYRPTGQSGRGMTAVYPNGLSVLESEVKER